MERDAEQRGERGTGGGSRDKYRDNDDVRDPLPPDQRTGTNSDSKSEARGDARENVGNTAHDRPGTRDTGTSDTGTRDR